MRIAILGAGSWSIALAVLLSRRNHRTRLWEFDENDARMLQEKREHVIKLPGVKLPGDVLVSNRLSEVLAEAEYVVCCVPAQTVRRTSQLLRKEIAPTVMEAVRAWIVASKGIECSSLSLLTQVLKEELPAVDDDRLVVLSGPSHAEEVSRGLPTTIVAASTNNDIAVEIQSQFSTETFRIYTNNDVTGVELCASVKNVIAVAAGICDGLGFGDNTKGALLTRGMVEMARLGMRLGADEMTFSGLAGFGDLVTTCFSRHSRNRRIGELLASGLSLDKALAKMTMVAEGVETTKSVYRLAQKYGIEMPITTEVYQALFKGKSAHEAVRDLMLRESGPERVEKKGHGWPACPAARYTGQEGSLDV